MFVIGCASEGDEQGDGVIVVVVEYREEDLWRIFPRTFKRFECVASLEGISADVLDATVKLDALEVAHAIEARTVQSFHVFWYFHFRDFFVLYKQAVGAPKRIDAETDIEPLAQIGDDDLVHSRKIALRNESKGAWKVKREHFRGAAEGQCVFAQASYALRQLGFEAATDGHVGR